MTTERFLWLPMGGMRRIEQLEPRQRKAARLLYLALAEMAYAALDAEHEGFEATGGEVERACDMHRGTVYEARDALIRVGLLRVDRVQRNLMRWVLLATEAPSVEVSDLPTPHREQVSVVRAPARAHGCNSEVQRQEALQLQPPITPQVQNEFETWLAHHESITGHRPPGTKTKARKAIAQSFNARRTEGWSLQQLQQATVGAHADDYRRENGYDVPESILRPTKINALVAKGRLRTASATDLYAQQQDRQLAEAERSRQRRAAVEAMYGAQAVA